MFLTHALYNPTIDTDQLQLCLSTSVGQIRDVLHYGEMSREDGLLEEVRWRANCRT